jgi:RHS repeat-associated protein
MTVKFRYDGAGVLRRVTSDHPGAPGGVAHQDVFDFKFRNKVVDAAGRVWRQEISCQGHQASRNACDGLPNKDTKNQYNRFGMLVRQEATGASPEIMRYDGSGNMIYRERFDGVVAANRRNSYMIDSAAGAAHNQLERVTEAGGIEIPLNILYTPDGARKWEKPDGTAKDYRETYYYYDGLGRMAGSVERDDDDLNTVHHFPGSCIYDPEGNLVVACNGGVYLSFEGQNVSGVLYNPQGHGWRFVHGPSIDDPLTGYHRLNGAEMIAYYVTDGQGRILAVADSSGERSSEFETTSGGRWRLAGGAQNAHSFNADRMSGADVPGLSFYRNRAYDQTTGRWTQEDPIGVAGGLNLYQFNGNNPVAYTDPFGLEACKLYGNCTQSDGGSYGLVDPNTKGGLEPVDPIGTAIFLTVAPEARALGVAGEAAAGIVKNTTRISSATGTAAFRVPDALSATALTEVKNVAKLSLTNQIRDFAAFAKETGRVFNLVVRETTKLSRPLREFIKNEGINLKFLP